MVAQDCMFVYNRLGQALIHLGHEYFMRYAIGVISYTDLNAPENFPCFSYPARLAISPTLNAGSDLSNSAAASIRFLFINVPREAPEIDLKQRFMLDSETP